MIDKRKEFYEILVNYFGKKQANQIDKNLNELAFYDLPCSTRYHLSVPHGLVEHSINVYKKCMELRQVICPHIPEIQVAIVSLFHDLNKCLAGYMTNILKSGEQSQAQPYVKDTRITGDGTLSCYLITARLKIDLSFGMYNAIANHNIFEPDYVRNHNIIVKDPNDYLLLLCLQTSDLYCSQVLEHIPKEKEKTYKDYLME